MQPVLHVTTVINAYRLNICKQCRDAVIADANFDGVPHVSSINATTQVAQFAAIGFTTQEMVALLGAHSIGVSANTAPKVSHPAPPLTSCSRTAPFAKYVHCTWALGRILKLAKEHLLRALTLTNYQQTIWLTNSQLL